MPNCKECGEEISEKQAQDFNNTCPECIRLYAFFNLLQHNLQVVYYGRKL